MLIILFLVSHFNFLFIPCGRLSWLPVSFLLHVKYTLSYRIHNLKQFHTHMSTTIYISVRSVLIYAIRKNVLQVI